MFQKPRGTNDWYDKSIDDFNYVIDKLKLISKNYNFKQIQTPTFEKLELFTKNIGNSTDIVKKEIYVFEDKSNRKLALRPEGTASVIRAYVENKLYGNNNYVSKFFYVMNMFRYDRPQKGRYREFYQFGVEYINTKSWYDTIECIAFADQILKMFEINSYVLKINNLGNFESRKKWIEELTNYFEQYKEQLTQDSVYRIYENPLRILDDKVDSKKDFVINCPKLDKFLTDNEKEEFASILKGLDFLKIKYEVDPSLVRGLDYYTNTVFEFISNLEELSKVTLIGGGNYAKLVKETGGPDYKGLGFAIGIERLIETLRIENKHLKPNASNKYLLALTSQSINLAATQLCLKLRAKNYNVALFYDEYKKAKLAKLAACNNINKIIWLNDDSFKTNKAELEDLNTNKKQTIDIKEFWG